MAQRTLAFRLHQEYDNDHEDVDVHIRWLKLWCTSAGCSAHDFSNSLRWSSLTEFADRQIMRRMWIVIESLRSSLDQLIGNLAGWIGDSIQFGDYHGPLCLSSVWRLLGIPEQWAHELAELEFRFESGYIIVGFATTRLCLNGWQIAICTCSSSEAGRTPDGVQSVGLVVACSLANLLAWGRLLTSFGRRPWSRSTT
jgi:hypothetical protein